MIEFKAECGHTVRAKDEDEGKVVRCSYCGLETEVPVQQSEDKDLDVLFRQLEQPLPASSASSRKKSRRARPTSPFPSAQQPFDPLRVAVKLGYAAIVIIILIVVGKLYVVPVISTLSASDSDQTSETSGDASHGSAPPSNNTSERGFLCTLPKDRSGVYVDTVPTGARIYVRKQSSVYPDEETVRAILNDPQADINRRARADIELNDTGTYAVVCILPISDRGLKRYPHYREYRQGVETGEVTLETDEFLMPDRALYAGAAMFRDEYIVYRLYEVEVAPRQWSQLVVLFLPYQGTYDHLKYMPSDRMYSFNVDDARSEMDYYEFDKSDQSFLTQALERIGGMIYHQPKGALPGYYWLEVGLTTGRVKIRRLSDTPAQQTSSTASTKRHP